MRAQDSSPDFYCPRLAVVGVGLIGGSLSLALKQKNCVGAVIGAGRSHANLEKAKSLGVIDEITDDVAQLIDADIIVLATPVNAIAEWLAAIAAALRENKRKNNDRCAPIITDVGSVKLGICQAAEVLGDDLARFVPAHPVAGKEHSGVAAAADDLFVNHNVVLTPMPQTAGDALETIRRLWQAAGARVDEMDAAVHDEVLSVTSHLPHVLAYSMVDYFAAADSDELARRYAMAAGGFYDFTRTASSDAAMWRDICLMNRAQILRDIEQFEAHLKKLADLIAESDGNELMELFAQARKVRGRVAERRKK